MLLALMTMVKNRDVIDLNSSMQEKESKVGYGSHFET